MPAASPTACCDNKNVFRYRDPNQRQGGRATEQSPLGCMSLQWTCLLLLPHGPPPRSEAAGFPSATEEKVEAARRGPCQTRSVSSDSATVDVTQGKSLSCSSLRFIFGGNLLPVLKPRWLLPVAAEYPFSLQNDALLSSVFPFTNSGSYLVLILSCVTSL